MKKTLTLLCIGACLFTMAGCQDEHEQVINDQLDWMEDMTSVLKDVKDADSANDAKEELEELIATQKEIQAKMKEIGEPAEERDKELKEEYEEKMKEASKALQAEMERIMKDPALAAIIGPVMAAAK